MKEGLLGTVAVAHQAGLSRQRIRMLVIQGKLKPARIQRRAFYFRTEDVAVFLAQRERAARLRRLKQLT
jgi:hypothetical protein